MNDGAGNKRRPRRTPPTTEEVARIRDYKQRLERINLKKFKQSRAYTWCNILNIACFFIYLEVILCFFGPADYSRHYSSGYSVNYGTPNSDSRGPVVEHVYFYGVDGKSYDFIVNDVITMPEKKTTFMIAKDFILRKEIKGRIHNSDTEYRLFSASPVLLLCTLVAFISLIAFNFDINENAYSLKALSVLNVINLLGILTL